MMTHSPLPTSTLSGGLVIPRITCGLWQVADIERSGTPIDPQKGGDALQSYVEAGFTAFDMADHYGTAELITGNLLSRYPEGSKRSPIPSGVPNPDR